MVVAVDEQRSVVEYVLGEKAMTTGNTTFAEVSNAVTQVANRFIRFSLRFSERKLLLVFVDIFLLNIALIATIGVHDGLQFSPSSVLPRLSWFVTLIIIWAVCSCTLECYNLFQAASIRRSLPHVGAACIITSTVYLMIPYVTPSLPTSRLVALAFPALSLVSIVAWRIIYAKVFVMRRFQQRTLIVGAGRTGNTL